MKASVRILATNSKGQVLLEFRDSRRKNIYDLTFCFFGGRVEEGEDILAAAAREFSEEIGIKVDTADFTPLIAGPAHQVIDETVHFFRYTKPVEWKDIRFGEESAGLAFVEYADLPRIPIGNLMQWFLKNYPECP